MKFAIYILNLLLTIASTQSITWREFNGHEYAVTDEFLTWNGAEATAVSVGGHLASINSREEEEWIEQTFGLQPAFWIGLTDEHQEGDFRWINGDVLSYLNWNSGEPNGGTGENYVLMNWPNADTHGWNDGNSVAFSPGIIERNVTNTPDTGTSSLLLTLALGGLILLGKHL